MLKDALENLISKTEEGNCRFGRLLQSELDPETAEVLKSAMRSNASTRAIWMAIKDDGHVVDRATVTAARACFKGTKVCACNLGPEGGES